MDVILTRNVLTRNDSSSLDRNKTDAQNSFQHLRLVLQRFFKVGLSPSEKNVIYLLQ